MERMFEEVSEMKERNDYKGWKIEAEEKFVSNDEAIAYIKKAKRGNEFAMETIVRKNLPMIRMYANQYRSNGSDVEDLVSEGMIAVVNAVRKFDIKADVTVGTVLITAVRTAMRRYTNSDRNIHIATNAAEIKNKIHAIAERMKANDEELSIEKIAKEANLTIEKAKKLFKIELGVVSMNVKSDSKDGEGDEMGDFIIAETKTPYEELAEKEKFSELANAVQKLNEVERTIIEFHFGLNGKETKTLGQIGKILGRSQEGVRVIEAKAFKKIQSMVMA